MIRDMRQGKEISNSIHGRKELSFSEWVQDAAVGLPPDASENDTGTIRLYHGHRLSFE